MQWYNRPQEASTSMAWLKARLVSFYEQLPAGGYGFAIVPAWLFGWLSAARHGFPGPALEWLAFVLAPALAGALHVIAPRTSRGGRWYWILAGVWFGAAVTGALAHWHALDPYTPWLSFARYVLLSAGVLLFYVAYALDRWCFGPPVPLRGNPRVRKVGSYTYLLIAALAISYLFYVTPFQQALAPRHRMVSVRRICTLPPDSEWVTASWSPDERWVAIQGMEGDGVSVVEVATGRATPVARDGAISPDRPWLPDGSGFLMLQRGEEAHRVWRVSPDGRQRHLLWQGSHTSPPTCSPDGTHIAYTQDHVLWVAGPDGSGARRLSANGRSPRWSPDGKRLLFVGVAQGKDGKWQTMNPPSRIAELTGQTHLLRLAGSDMSAVGWLDSDSLISMDDRETHRLLDPFDLCAISLQVWDVDGRRRRRSDFRDLLGIYTYLPSVAPDHRTVVAPNNAIFPASSARPAFYLLDAETGRITAVPVGLRLGDSVADIAWSHDGRRLLFQGTDHFADSFGNSEWQNYLAVIEGL